MYEFVNNHHFLLPYIIYITILLRSKLRNTFVIQLARNVKLNKCAQVNCNTQNTAVFHSN